MVSSAWGFLGCDFDTERRSWRPLYTDRMQSVCHPWRDLGALGHDTSSFLSCRDDPGTVRVRIPLNARRGSGLAPRHVHPGYPWHQAWAPCIAHDLRQAQPPHCARRVRRAAAARTGTPPTYDSASFASDRYGLFCIAHWLLRSPLLRPRPCSCIACLDSPRDCLYHLQSQSSPCGRVGVTVPGKGGSRVGCCRRGRRVVPPFPVSLLWGRREIRRGRLCAPIRVRVHVHVHVHVPVHGSAHAIRSPRAPVHAFCDALSVTWCRTAMAATMPDGVRHRFQDGRRLIAAVMVRAGSRRANSAPA